MKWSLKLLLMGLGLAGLMSYRSAGVPLPYKTLLTPEQLQVYGDFIESFSKTNFRVLSNRTFPLDLSGLGKDAACLQGLQLEDTQESSHSIHSLGSEVLRGHSIQIVDEQQETSILKQRDSDVATHGKDYLNDASGIPRDLGVLALSEIVFDKSHRFAVLKYVFLCGAHCNSGAILGVYFRNESRQSSVKEFPERGTASVSAGPGLIGRYGDHNQSACRNRRGYVCCVGSLIPLERQARLNKSAVRDDRRNFGWSFPACICSVGTPTSLKRIA